MLVMLSLSLSGCSMIGDFVSGMNPTPTPTPTATTDEDDTSETEEESEEEAEPEDEPVDEEASEENLEDKGSPSPTEDVNGATIADLQAYLTSDERNQFYTQLVTKAGKAIATSMLKGDLGKFTQLTSEYSPVEKGYSGWVVIDSLGESSDDSIKAFVKVWRNADGTIDYGKCPPVITITDRVDGEYRGVNLIAPNDDIKFWTWDFTANNLLSAFKYDARTFVDNGMSRSEAMSKGIPYTPESLEEVEEFDGIVINTLVEILYDQYGADWAP